MVVLEQAAESFATLDGAGEFFAVHRGRMLTFDEVRRFAADDIFRRFAAAGGEVFWTHDSERFFERFHQFIAESLMVSLGVVMQDVFTNRVFQ